jgi:hypothetical protein
VYLQARQKREILSRLREQQKSEYELRVSRREQQSADETFLLHTFLSIRTDSAACPANSAEAAPQEKHICGS